MTDAINMYELMISEVFTEVDGRLPMSVVNVVDPVVYTPIYDTVNINVGTSIYDTIYEDTYYGVLSLSLLEEEIES
jgi:hypothetical protein